MRDHPSELVIEAAAERTHPRPALYAKHNIFTEWLLLYWSDMNPLRTAASLYGNTNVR